MPLVGKGVLTASRPVPSCVLVAVDDEESRFAAMATAAQLRARGIATEVAPKADKFGKQIRYADRLGDLFVWFASGEVKGTSAPASRCPPTPTAGCCRTRTCVRPS